MATEVKGLWANPTMVVTGVINKIVVATELERMPTLARVNYMVKDNTRPGDATTAVLFNIVIGLSIIVINQIEETEVLLAKFSQARLSQARPIVVLVRA